MVRVNLIPSTQLSDQHLIAEYREILMLFGYYRKHPVIQPSQNHFCPMRFYHDKLQYLMRRWIALKVEMIMRGFNPTINLHYKELQLRDEFQGRFKDFVPSPEQIKSMKERITQRISEKPNWYRYNHEYKSPQFFQELMQCENADINFM